MIRLLPFAFALLPLAFSSPQAAQAIPVSHFADEVPLGGRLRQRTIYSFPKYYKDPQGRLVATQERLVPGAGGYLAEATEGVHHLFVARDGLMVMCHWGVCLRSRLVGIAAAAGDGAVVKAIAVNLADWPAQVQGNRVVWTGPNGLVFEACYNADTASGVLTIPVQQLPVVQKALPAGARRVGPLFEWSEEYPDGWARVPAGDCDRTDDIRWTNGIQQQAMRQSIVPARVAKQEVHLKKHYILRKQGNVFAELVELEALQSTEPLVFNASITYQQGVAGYTGMADNWLNLYYPTYNYGSYIYGRTFRHAAIATGYGKELERWTVSDVPGEITAANLAHYNTGYGAGNAYYCTAYKILSGNTGWSAGASAAMEETGASCWSYHTFDTQSWAGSPGLGTADTDYDSTMLGQVQVDPTVAGWFNYDITASVVEAWRTGTNDGLLICSSNSGAQIYNLLWYSADHSSTSLRPKLTITYTAGAAGVPPPLLRSGVVK